MSNTKQGVKVVVAGYSPYLGFGRKPLFEQFLGTNTSGESAPRQGQIDPKQRRRQCRKQPFGGTLASIVFRNRHPASSQARRTTAWEV
jgi:hypothetical protein